MPRKQVLVALVVALVASAMTYVYISGAAETEQVVVAAADLAQGSPVTAQVVRLARVPRTCVHPSAFRRREDVVGRYASQPIIAGEQVLRGRIASGERAWPTAGLAADLRAVFVPLPASRAVGGAMSPGERVDLIFVSQADRFGAPMSRMILGSVPVIAASFEADAGRARPQGAAARGWAGSAEGVLLAVTPADAERIAFCLENGQIYLAGVPYGADPVQTDGITWNDLFRREDAGATQAPVQ